MTLRRAKPKLPPIRRPRVPSKAVVYAKARRAVYRRSKGACERCGVGIPEDAFQAHHRLMRSQGGRDEVVNLVALDDRCHDHIHHNPAESYEQGWLVRSFHDPAFRPVLRWGRWWRATDSGHWEESRPPEPS